MPSFFTGDEKGDRLGLDSDCWFRIFEDQDRFPFLSFIPAAGVFVGGFLS